MKKTYIKIEFINLALAWDYVIAEKWKEVDGYISMVDIEIAEFEPGDCSEGERPEIRIYPIRMTEEEYAALIEKWEEDA